MNKAFWKSKTFWVNLAGLVGMAVPSVQAFVTENASQIGMVWSALNIVLRAVTKDKIVLTES
jgi:hypothetical protein